MTQFRETWPDHRVSMDVFEVDQRRLTCSGGAASMDMMLYIIEQHHGHELAASVAESMIHPHIRHGSEPQRMDITSRTGVSHPDLIECIELIEANIEQPLTPAELANLVGISKRQLERLFRRYLNTTPARYYLTLRLETARRMLEKSSMKIIDVAIACGFKSAGHFSSRYYSSFGVTPRESRKLAVKWCHFPAKRLPVRHWVKCRRNSVDHRSAARAYCAPVSTPRQSSRQPWPVAEQAAGKRARRFAPRHLPAIGPTGSARTRGRAGSCPLQSADLERVHATILDLLEQVGFSRSHPELYRVGEPSVGGDLPKTVSLKFPRALVEDTIANARPGISRCMPRTRPGTCISQRQQGSFRHRRRGGPRGG